MIFAGKKKKDLRINYFIIRNVLIYTHLHSSVVIKMDDYWYLVI